MSVIFCGGLSRGLLMPFGGRCWSGILRLSCTWLWRGLCRCWFLLGFFFSSFSFFNFSFFLFARLSFPGFLLPPLYPLLLLVFSFFLNFLSLSTFFLLSSGLLSRFLPSTFRCPRISWSIGILAGGRISWSIGFRGARSCSLPCWLLRSPRF